MEIIVATRNLHKLEEIRHILAGLPVRLVPAAEAGAPEVEEDAPTLEGNARKKARSAADATGKLALADDTGLLVDWLDGRPGVYSARYAGAHGDAQANMKKLLRELDGVPAAKRGARFECVIALARPGEDLGTVTGALPGAIATEPRGGNGFGYDPVFLVARDAKNRTLAELSSDEKNRISHRARALEQLRARLLELVSRQD
jgi:XTP/dITP diphosphohydrolase